MFLLLNLILSIDIYFLMVNPFKPARMRQLRYFMFLGSYFLIMVLAASFIFIYRYGVSDFSGDEKTNSINDKGWIVNHNFQLTYSLVIYPLLVIVNTGVIGRIICRLTHKGTSRRLMKAIRNRYIIYYLLIIPFYAVSIIILYYDTNNNQQDVDSLLKILKSVLLVSGFLKASIRLHEPFVYQNFRDILKNRRNLFCFKSKYTELEPKAEDPSINFS